MAVKEKIYIIGAGLSGMIAGINLAKENYEITILEAESGIGGSDNYHPSLHITPIEKEKVWKYIGIDLEDCFTPVDILPLYVEDRLIPMKPTYYSGVERGKRPTSIDSRLYKIACDHGVKFMFGSRIDKINDMPPGTIIATGLAPEMYEHLNLPYRDAPAMHTWRESAVRNNYALSIFSQYASEYFYAAEFNKILYCMLPVKDGSKIEMLKYFLPDLSRLEKIDIPFEEWKFASFRIPMGGVENLRLFHGDKILAGTISGMMDPFLLFGIHGAIISGKIAAMAVADKEKAKAEFDRVNRYFRASLRIKKLYDMVPLKPRIAALNVMASVPLLFSPLIKMMCRGVPGYEGPPYLYRGLID